MKDNGLKEALKFACTAEFWRMAVFWTLSLVVSYFQLFAQSFFRGNFKFSASVSPFPYKTAFPGAMASKRPICIITGATSGLGAAAALALSREGFYVVLAGRSSLLLLKTVSDIKRQNNDAVLKTFEVDLSSFQSILKFKGSLLQWLLASEMHSSVQLLVNNAGILSVSSRPSCEGYDKMMATNYLGSFFLTKLLLPLLLNSPVPSRIVNITSFTHRNVSGVRVDKENVSGKQFLKLHDYPFARVYEYSKFCLLLFSYELHRQLDLLGGSKKVSVIAVDPGAVKTNIMREVPSTLSRLAFLALRLVGLLQSPNAAAGSIVDAALAPPGTSGVYIFGGNGRAIRSSALSYDERISKELWDTSCELLEELLLLSSNIYSDESHAK